jgi:hypothetical protein
MSSYSTKRNWMNQLDKFTPEQQNALLALSHDKYKWRTRCPSGKRAAQESGAPSGALF